MKKNFLLILASVTLILIFFQGMNIFGKILGEADNGEVEIILTGDVMLGRTVMTKSLDLNDPTYPFKKVRNTLNNADLVFVNLENLIVESCPRHYDGLKFCAAPQMLDGLTYAGINVLTLANNHTLNYGQSGLEETKSHLDKKGISYTGSGNLVVKEVGGTKFGFLGFEFIDKNISDVDLKLVKDSDTKVDVLVVGVHWGSEYKDTASQKQREIAKKLVDNGADVVVGHHPHWIQDIEYIEGKPVYYSLGNFVFDQMWSQKTRQGLVIKLVFDGAKLVKEEKMPIYMSSWSQPEFVK